MEVIPKVDTAQAEVIPGTDSLKAWRALQTGAHADPSVLGTTSRFSSLLFAQL